VEDVQKIAFILIGGGVLVALGFFLRWFFLTSFISLGFRIAIAVVIAGVLLLLASISWERYRISKRKEEDKFKEVKY